MNKSIILSLLFNSLMSFCGDETIKPLEGAVWNGVLRLEAKGPQFTQYLANHKSEDGRVAFVKEKGEMKIDLVLEINILINDLGEFELLAVEKFSGDYLLNREARSRFKEEVKRKRLNFKQDVQEAFVWETDVHYVHEATYHRDTFNFGSFRVLPSGRLDKKGRLQITAELEFTYEGKGSYTEVRERQPPSPKDKNVKSVGDVTKPYTIPLKFDVQIDLKGKPVSGQFPVTTDVKNPFPKEEGDTGKANYRSSIVLTGSYQLTPLFGKKKK